MRWFKGSLRYFFPKFESPRETGSAIRLWRTTKNELIFRVVSVIFQCCGREIANMGFLYILKYGQHSYTDLIHDTYDLDPVFRFS